MTGMPRSLFDREAIEAEIGRVRSLDLDELRTLWRVTFRSSPSSAFTKDLMARRRDELSIPDQDRQKDHRSALVGSALLWAASGRCGAPDQWGARWVNRTRRRDAPPKRHAVRFTPENRRRRAWSRPSTRSTPSGSDGGRSGGICFGVGSLAHLLKNRFYLGEVPSGEVHRGEHEPILGRDLFEAVQAKRAANAVARQVRLRGAAAILTGRLFDDRGNRMSPTHANKLGVRYRYYVSQAILQNRKVEAGSIARVPAPEIETLVCEGIRRHLAAMGDGEPADRDLIEHHVARVIVKPQALEVCLIPNCEASAQAEDHGLQDPAPHRPLTTTITLAWTAPSFAAMKGIIHAPCAKRAMRPENRDALLTAIAKARGWVDDIRLGRIASFAEIAEREAQGERHIRLLAPVAFLSPRSLRRSSMAPRLRISPSPASPRPCPIPGSSRSRTSDCDAAR